MGHSMGGMGALNLFLRTSQYRSASAFSPACNPTKSQWGIKALTAYLKDGIEEGENYDPSCLLEKAKRTGVNILVDYGDADQFYKDGQLRPEAFQEAADRAGFSHESVKVRSHEGYDHSYYFVRFFLPVIDAVLTCHDDRFQHLPRSISSVRWRLVRLYLC
jgi:S-formylglutathione hydrolase